jgi:YYY domain-containing protein
MMHESDRNANLEINKQTRSWVTVLLMVIILTSGAYLRLVGIDWDENQHLHPDERFLTMVEAQIMPISTPDDELGAPPTTETQSWREPYRGDLRDCESWGGYFDTACSPLNPNNRGYDYYVYGTLPIFIVRYAAEWVDLTGYGEVYLVGRVLSAVSDLFVIFLVFAIADLIYDRRVAVLASAFSAFSVLLIQQSHFFTVDTFTNFFILLAVYFAVKIAVTGRKKPENQRPKDAEGLEEHPRGKEPIFLPDILFYCILFGAALGMAVASKINAAPLAVILPGAAAIFLMDKKPSVRDRQVIPIFGYLVVAALVSLLAFRIFQPYAFEGPGFLGVKPNQAWIDDLKALRGQTGGDVDFPPALQWARRPVWFSLKNMVVWGLGIPLGITAWIGFLSMGWRIFKGEWRKHSLLWGWTGLYFVWQSLQWNSTMRYQLPIYPLLGIIAAWFVIYLWDSTGRKENSRRGIMQPFIVLLGALLLVMTISWAYAFSRIYTRPHTRVEASRWLFQNMPGRVNLQIQTEGGPYNQPLAFPENTAIQPGFPQSIRFTALVDGKLTEVFLPNVVDKLVEEDIDLAIRLFSPEDWRQLVSEDFRLSDNPITLSEPTGYTLTDPVILSEGEVFSLVLDVSDGFREVAICGPVTISLQTLDVVVTQEFPILTGCLGRNDLPYSIEFTAESNGILETVYLSIQVEKPEPADRLKTIGVEINTADNEVLAYEEVTSSFSTSSASGGTGYQIPINESVALEEGKVYSIKFSLLNDSGAILFSGSVPANESSWDDGLPLRMDGHDPYGGIYPGGLNFEMYWDDNEEKLERFVSTLDRADTILITSSRQWGSTTRVPERYPLTTEYYDRLMGCPAGQTIEWCYNVARPGDFQGELGFDLIKVFQSNPSIGSFEINDQFAEEAFTVYDHPKVFVFKKSNNYDPVRVREILGAVDLSKVIRITPKQADSHPGNLLLPPGRLEEQQHGGTWSDYFNPDAVYNRIPFLAVPFWYLSVSLLGWLVYPLVRYALPGLEDRGYPFARVTGLLSLSALIWLAGSAQIPFNRWTISAGILMLGLAAAILGYLQKDELRHEIKQRWRYYLLIEGLFILFFAAGILIRFGNPDLWHPWKGGEKPMDFSYFNAILKSTSFPPYDPWFAGGYINYYYYGFVVVGVLVKYTGILPAIAYNLILATLFSMIAMGAFSVVWNLISKDPDSLRVSFAQVLPAAGGAVGMAVLGNLGVLQMFTRGFQINAAPGGNIDAGGFISKFIWTITGFFNTISGTPLPFRTDEWYWNPSRVIAYEHGNPITEFPYFTFLYGDLHAHLIALPAALLGVAWVVSVVRGDAWKREGRRSLTQVGSGIILGGLVIGALYPINLSDIYTYLPLGSAALIYAIWRNFKFTSQEGIFKGISPQVKKIALAAVAVLALYLVTQFIYQPYIYWYGQGYKEVRIWDGTHTPISEYLTHWGLFLFILVSWMYDETIQWMANTPVSALRKLEPYKGLIWMGGAVLVISMLILGINLHPGGTKPDQFPVGLGIHIAWLVLPLITWAGVLLLKPGLSESKRMVLFFIGTGLVLTLMVETIVVSGDIGRMNTVFKFYLHVWTLFAVSSGAAIGWIIAGMRKWQGSQKAVWQVALSALVFSAALYPLLATPAKIIDRMETEAPYTLNGMTYMKYASYHDEGVEMDLSQDYNAIRWMHDHVTGSPVIVEANSVEYHWGTRYTIYTGLPGVVGWNWHQRQQRTATPHDWVFERVDEIHEFYQTQDLALTKAFLKKYDVSYVILGQLEQAKYPGPGLDKFSQQDGVLWQEVFRDRNTRIFEVNKTE